MLAHKHEFKLAHLNQDSNKLYTYHLVDVPFDTLIHMATLCPCPFLVIYLLKKLQPWLVVFSG